MHGAPFLRRCQSCSHYMCLHTRRGSAAESPIPGLQADKSVLTAQLNLHTRDLRILDPMLTQMNPCAILINLEHVKCIVTMEYVLVLNVENRAVLSFLDELQKKLKQQVSANRVAHVLHLVRLCDVDMFTSHWICEPCQSHVLMVRCPPRITGVFMAHAIALPIHLLVDLA